MIAKLKKFTFLIYHREYHDLLDTLREEGVVHIAEMGRSDEDEESADERTLMLKRYDKAIRVLNRLSSESEADKPGEAEKGNPDEVLRDVERLLEEREEISSAIQLMRSDAVKIEGWGDYDLKAIEKLPEKGWQFSFFSSPSKRFDEEWEKRYNIAVINQVRGKIYFVVLHKPDEVIDIDADPEKPGEKSAPQLYSEIEQMEARDREIVEELTGNARQWLDSLEDGKRELINSIEYSNAEKQGAEEADGKLIVLQGWIPEESAGELTGRLDKTGCYYMESEPEPGEKIPVLLRNNSFAKLFEPISKLFDLPDYRELDLTPFFAPFFMMFFGFCLGDAGYGLIFIGAGFLLYNRVKPSLRPIMSLAKYLGIATVLFGLISGTFFGMNLIDSGYRVTAESIAEAREDGVPTPVIEALSSMEGVRIEGRSDYLEEITATRATAIAGDLDQLPRPERETLMESVMESEVNPHRTALLRSAEPDFSLLKSFRHLMQEPINMFYLAILIGALQIIFGMVVKIINITIQKGFRYSLATVGWVLLIINLIIFKGGEAVGIIREGGGTTLFNIFAVISLVLIFLLNNPALNIFFRIGSGVWDTYNVLTGVFGDLLSYIRLFALGISSAILGFVFNDIASQFLSIPYIGWLFFVLLLLIGHSINIFMASLGGFIHPMRLTFVEFYKNAGFRGGGKAYKPFRVN